MKKQATVVYVFADWLGIDTTKLVGKLRSEHSKGKQLFSFEYDKNWLKGNENFILDPNLTFYPGKQFSENENFGVFLDSMPDTWGRTLMKRRVALDAEEKKEPVPKLFDVDCLLGIHDNSRMGGLRFKLEVDGAFLNDNKEFSTPPWTSIRELQEATEKYESDIENHQELKDILNIILAPGSSLGGARPKASVIDENGELWIAKFPAKNDDIDKAAWEYLTYQLATKCGVVMSESRIQKVTGKYHTFFTKRFDRKFDKRIHFSSAMTMLNYTEVLLRDVSVSYLELADFIQNNTIENKKDLEQLWRRIVFNIAVSNTDDHLRNHGFLVLDNEWRLSPAFDINPSTDKPGLSLNIDMEDSSLSFELAKSVGEFFQLTNERMDSILIEIKEGVGQWKNIAKRIGIPASEQALMAPAFKLPSLE